MSRIIILDLDVIDELVIRYSAFFLRMLTVLECIGKSSIYTLQESLGERKTLKSLIVFHGVRYIQPKTVLFVAYLRTRNQDVTERFAKADRQGIQKYI